jgi:hypothetical protein
MRHFRQRKEGLANGLLLDNFKPESRTEQQQNHGDAVA